MARATAAPRRRDAAASAWWARGARAAWVLAIPCLISLLGAGAAEAARPRETWWIVRWPGDGGEVTLRAGPSDDELHVASLADGTWLRDLGCIRQRGERWCRVEVDGDEEGTRGWVREQDIRPPGPGDRRGRAPRPPPERLAYDGEGVVDCSSPHDRIDELCAYRLARDLRGVTLLLANPAADGATGLRVIRYEGGEFSTRDGAFVWSQVTDDGRGWLVSVGNREHYLIKRELLFSGG